MTDTPSPLLDAVQTMRAVIFCETAKERKLVSSWKAKAEKRNRGKKHLTLAAVRMAGAASAPQPPGDTQCLGRRTFFAHFTRKI
jgi:hypothetical protein